MSRRAYTNAKFAELRLESALPTSVIESVASSLITTFEPTCDAAASTCEKVPKSFAANYDAAVIVDEVNSGGVRRYSVVTFGLEDDYL